MAFNPNTTPLPQELQDFLANPSAYGYKTWDRPGDFSFLNGQSAGSWLNPYQIIGPNGQVMPNMSGGLSNGQYSVGYDLGDGLSSDFNFTPGADGKIGPLSNQHYVQEDKTSFLQDLMQGAGIVALPYAIGTGLGAMGYGGAAGGSSAAGAAGDVGAFASDAGSGVGSAGAGAGTGAAGAGMAGMGTGAAGAGMAGMGTDAAGNAVALGAGAAGAGGAAAGLGGGGGLAALGTGAGLLSNASNIAGIVGGVNSLLNSGTGKAGTGYGSGVPYYQPTGQPQADQAWLQAMQQQQNATSGIQPLTQPVYQQELQNQLGIDYSPLATAGAQAGQYAGQGAAGLMQNASAIQQQAFDPQQALYNRTLAQLTDQINAQQGLRGLGTSPVGAAEMNQGLSNFNIDWQNQQLNRMTQGNTAMGQDYAAAPQLANAAGQYPVQGQQAMYQAPGLAAQNYTTQIGGMLQPGAAMQNQNLGYMNYGTGNAGSAYNAFSNQQQFGAQQQQAGVNGLLSGLNGLFGGGGTTGTTGGVDFAGTQGANNPLYQNTTPFPQVSSSYGDAYGIGY